MLPTKVGRFLVSSRYLLINNERLVMSRMGFSVGQARRDELEVKETKQSPKSKETFAYLVRNSPLIRLGSPENKVAIGKIVETVDDDLYIDFGFKFKGVCKKPKQDGFKYVRGSRVKVRINSLELSDRFLGSTKDLTLLEADISLIGLVSTPTDPAKAAKQESQ